MSGKKGFNRREFLKIVGATGGLAAAGCSRELPKKLIPYMVAPDDSVPGVAAWYASTCRECSAGCGVLVRTREGRAVKVEGNPRHPINEGGLCAIGQSALQSLYDPDRIREPLRRDAATNRLTPVGWPAAVNEAAEAIAKRAPGTEFVLITKPLTGSEGLLADEFIAGINQSRRIEIAPADHELLDRAAEKVFGPACRTYFDFSSAEVICSFGAGFLEEWVSPVEFARQWAVSRKPEQPSGPSYFIHFEPRLSLTAANADRWVKTAPGADLRLLVLLAREIAKINTRKRLPANVIAKINEIAAALEAEQAPAECELEADFIPDLARRLAAARSALVIAGGPALSGENALLAPVLADIINAALGAFGRTAFIEKTNRPLPVRSGYQQLLDLVRSLNTNDGKASVIFLADLNPVYDLPGDSGAKEALIKAGRLIAACQNLDESAVLADLVFPLSSSLESWGETVGRKGLVSLTQPAMMPLFQTQALGDTLIAVGARLGINFHGATTLEQYIKAQWAKRIGAAGVEEQWLSAVESGGDWRSYRQSREEPAVMDSSLDLPMTVQRRFDETIFMAFPTVSAVNGSAANRPWLQELPNPITTAVWGAWLEIHPLSADKLGLRAGQTVQVSGAPGQAIQLPVYLTEHIHPRLVAAPLGQGHESLGRYADGVGANARWILKSGGDAPVPALLISGVGLEPGFSQETLVTLQGNDSQLERGLVRKIKVSELSKAEQSPNGDKSQAPAQNNFPGIRQEREDRLGRTSNAAEQMYRQSETPLYRWGMSIDLASCTGCSACVVACYSENNVSVAGKQRCDEGREMSWIRIERYLDGGKEQPVSGFMPMLCQHCGNAPCEPVCPVYATYHNEEGLNSMVYNRCVGTRYCSNNCSYKVRRFNWFRYRQPETLNWQLNPDVAVREVGVMEKCTFCVQRIREAENLAKNLGRAVADGDVSPACASSCPTRAITFGNLLDAKSAVHERSLSSRGYRVLDSRLNTQPAITYLARVENTE